MLGGGEGVAVGWLERPAGRPQSMQKRASAGSARPQLSQRRASADPHWRKKRASPGFSCWQPGQRIPAILRAALYGPGERQRVRYEFKAILLPCRSNNSALSILRLGAADGLLETRTGIGPARVAGHDHGYASRGDDWDFWEYVELPLEVARKRLGVPPLNAA